MVRPRKLSQEHRVRRLAPDDWEIYKRIRLRALETDPSAFGSTLAQASLLTDDEWSSRLTKNPMFIGEADGEAMGLAGAHHRDGFAELISMWVAPRARGSGLAAMLIEAVVDWAAGEGYPEVRLWVVEGNASAQRAYEKSGFAATGRRQPVREGEAAMELEMARATTGLRQTS